MVEDYGTLENGDDTSEHHEEEVQITISDEKPNKPTLGPVGRRMKRNAQIQYNPYDWQGTLFSLHDGAYVSRSFYVVGIIGTVLVLLSGIAGIGLKEDDRECRAWCSRFALGTQPHSYMGFILFLLMAFRTREAYRMYQAGLSAHYKVKELLRRFVDAMLFKTPRNAIDSKQRARMVAYCCALPYAFTAEMREERRYDPGTIQNLLSEQDMKEMLNELSMPLYVIESLVVMVRKYCSEKCSTITLKRMFISLEMMYGAYGEMEKIKQSPCAFAYVAHLRFLLVTYLVTLPLALVEQMGFQTIIVFWVICYGLMTLEMMAVEVENPYGYGASDLRMHDYNLLVKDSLLESWNRWKAARYDTVTSERRLDGYADFTNMANKISESEDDGTQYTFW